jgi:type VI protein secretion system component VasK
VSVPLVAWIAALAIAVVVLAFCGYEVTWKARRLRRDVARLRELSAAVEGVQQQVAHVQQRIAALTRSDAGTG